MNWLNVHNPAGEFIMIVGMMLVTFGVRYPVLALMSRVTLPPTLIEALKFIPPAVLSAIIVPAVFMPNGQFDVSPGNSYLVAGMVAAALAWRTKNLLLTIVAGMAFFVLWRMGHQLLFM